MIAAAVLIRRVGSFTDGRFDRRYRPASLLRQVDIFWAAGGLTIVRHHLSMHLHDMPHLSCFKDVIYHKHYHNAPAHSTCGRLSATHISCRTAFSTPLVNVGTISP